MTQIQEKIVAMLATIKEMRKSLVPKSVFGFIASHSPINQKDLFYAFPAVSSRTMRRRLEDLIGQNLIMRQKDGREVYYRIYPQKPA